MANWATDTSYCAYSNPDYDKLYEELKGEMDPEKRKDHDLPDAADPGR